MVRTLPPTLYHFIILYRNLQNVIGLICNEYLWLYIYPQWLKKVLGCSILEYMALSQPPCVVNGMQCVSDLIMFCFWLQLRLPNMTNIVALDYDVMSQRMFWADTTNNEIYSADITHGANVTTVSKAYPHYFRNVRHLNTSMMIDCERNQRIANHHIWTVTFHLWHLICDTWSVTLDLWRLICGT